jgi:hypothetical protein
VARQPPPVAVDIHHVEAGSVDEQRVVTDIATGAVAGSLGYGCEPVLRRVGDGVGEFRSRSWRHHERRVLVSN